MHKNIYKEKNINATRFLKRCQKEKVEWEKREGVEISNAKSKHEFQFFHRDRLWDMQF
jgi:hypothetical protein